MLKLTIGGILCFISTYLGVVGKGYYDKRYKYLKTFYDFLLAMIDGINYSKDRLSEIGKRFLDGAKGAFCDDLSQFLNCVEEGGSGEEIAKCFDSKYLKKGDKKYIGEFFASLGKTDYDTQISRLNLAKAEIEKIVAGAEKECKTTGNLLSKLGLLIGISIMIILA